MSDTVEVNRELMARQVMAALDQWSLSTDEIVSLLDLSGATRRRQLDQFRSGKPLPEVSSLLTRAQHIIGIAEALRTSFPRNSKIGARWLVTPHRRFRSRTPLSLMLDDGINGLCRVRAELDCSFSWARAQE